MKDKLPSYHDLDEMRVTWIKRAVADGDIDAAHQVASHFGSPFEVKNYLGQFFRMRHQHLVVESYEWSGDYSPQMERAFTKTCLVILDHDKLFVRLNLHEPHMTPAEDNVVVPGRWQDVVRKLAVKMRRDEAEKEAERDLEQRTELAKRLHLLD